MHVSLAQLALRSIAFSRDSVARCTVSDQQNEQVTCSDLQYILLTNTGLLPDSRDSRILQSNDEMNALQGYGTMSRFPLSELYS